MEVAVVVGLIVLLVWLFRGANEDRVRKWREEEERLVQQAEEWDGVTDVRREIKRDLTNPDERQRLFDKYNKTDNS